MHIKPVSLCLLLLAALGTLSACSKPAPPEEPLRAVKVMTVGEDAQHSTVQYAGEVLARVESRLGFRVAGKIMRRTVELGQRVKAGQPLMLIDTRAYDEAVVDAQAALAESEANLARARQD